jgi:phospholipid/cholesterol/gamma-HCH transport system permease protein
VIRDTVDSVRDITSLFGETVRKTFRRPFRVEETIQAIGQIGIGSLPIITLATASAGVVVSIEIAWHMQQSLHTVSMVPGFTAQFVLRELAIVVPALLLVAKAGAAITAEVGSMKVTEQIDALKLLRIDPVNYLVVPRFVASIVSSACLTVFAAAVTLGCAVAVSVMRYGFSTLEYLNALKHFVGMQDVFFAIIKGVVFGAVIPIVSCSFGFRCKGGAEGVGSATTNSVVTSTLLVITLDFVLTYLFTLIG